MVRVQYESLGRRTLAAMSWWHISKVSYGTGNFMFWEEDHIINTMYQIVTFTLNYMNGRVLFRQLRLSNIIGNQNV